MGATTTGGTKAVRNCYGCVKCRELFYCTSFDYNVAKTGSCAGGGNHTQATVELMIDDRGTGEKGWRFCKKCGALYSASDATAETCIGKASHSPDVNEFTVIKTAVDKPANDTWCKCKKCFCMFQRNSGANGTCAKSGNHEEAASETYAVAQAPKN